MRYFICGIMLSIGACLLITSIKGFYLLHEINRYMKTRGITKVTLEEFYDYLNSK